MCVYSALYDDRQFVTSTTPTPGFGDSQPAVRIFVLISAYSRNTVAEDFLCKFWSRDPLSTNESLRLTDDVIAEAVPAQMTILGRGHSINVTLRANVKIPHYAQRMLSCPVTSSGMTSFSHVSVISNRFVSRTIGNVLPIFRPKPTSTYRHEFGVCVPIAFGTLDVVNLIQWLEIHRHLGVGEFNIYNASLDGKVDKVLRLYSDIVRVHQIVPPVSDRNYGGVKLGSAAGINDCLMRYSYRYRYILLVDFDEVIVPRNDVNYPTFMSDIVNITSRTKHQSLASYNFRNAYFFKTFSPFASYAPIFTFLNYRYRMNESSAFGKSIIDPRLCFVAFNHGCLAKTPSRLDSLKLGHVSFVDSFFGGDIALVHHYRNCGRKQMHLCVFTPNTTVRDDVMLRYADFLLASVNHALGALGMSYRYRKL